MKEKNSLLVDYPDKMTGTNALAYSVLSVGDDDDEEENVWNPARQHSTLSDDDVHVGRSQYLTANCVVYTFFRGDISQVIDDHFARALSQSASDKPKGKDPL